MFTEHHLWLSKKKKKNHLCDPKMPYGLELSLSRILGKKEPNKADRSR